MSNPTESDLEELLAKNQARQEALKELRSAVESEHARLTRQMNRLTWENGFHQGCASRLKKAIEGSLWLITSMRDGGHSYEEIVYQVERRLLETMALDATIREQEMPNAATSDDLRVPQSD